jgi:hypothetical protein
MVPKRRFIRLDIENGTIQPPASARQSDVYIVYNRQQECGSTMFANGNQ